jgi:hypothetical protein
MVNAQTASDRDIGQFAAALSLLLAGIKLDDDVNDSTSWRAMLARRLLKRRIARARRVFETLDDEFVERVNDFLQRHRAFEVSGRPMSIIEYAVPTAEAFQYVFGMAAGLPGLRGHGAFLQQLGYEVGAAIVSFDCAADCKRDALYGHFNPLAGQESVRSALDFSRRSIETATRLCEAYIGPGSRTARILRSVAAGLGSWSPDAVPETRFRETLELLGLVGQRKYVYARSDCGATCFGACCCLALLKAACDDRKTVHIYHHKGCG